MRREAAQGVFSRRRLFQWLRFLSHRFPVWLHRRRIGLIEFHNRIIRFGIRILTSAERKSITRENRSSPCRIPPWFFWEHDTSGSMMLNGFKEFILRGNVIDLAVAVVIGAAFTSIVTSIVEGVINPAIGALFNASDLAEAFPLSIPTVSGGEAIISFGAVLAAVINFLLVALVVYFALIVPVNVLKRHAESRKNAGRVVVQEPILTEIDLLVEIRDLLAKPAIETGKHTDS